jgi:hypothetical protein
MEYNKESAKSQILELFRTAKPVQRNQKVPQITIRGDNNLINLGTRGVVRVNRANSTHSAPQVLRNGEWPQQILDAIRIKGVQTRRSYSELCEIAGRTLGRPVLTLDKLGARELARVYEAICASEHKQ